ncbi:TlpA family protein disulfide reductase [Ideonella sp. 4Y11]|uniref:TlpA family protein disulfide reductase n=1 Tax=Ideonella aquatica TaxID=2824119 RepID=A0A941BHQ5_9BURK|nr:TlpA disulfide reductase family protein [Ideonella aquatica]MBQ0957867.1 TlpA family protein disulfide reductase [Ideonella aquatica]
MNRRSALLTGGGLGLAAVAGAGLWWRQRRDPADLALAEFLQGQWPRPDGQPLSLAAFAGQPLLLNFWATWCPPCVRELPELDRFAQEWSNAGGRVLGVAIDRDASVREFLVRTPVNFPMVVPGFAAMPWLSRLGNGGGALPYTLLAGADGRIRQRRLGATSLEELRRWVA